MGILDMRAAFCWVDSYGLVVLVMEEEEEEEEEEEVEEVVVAEKGRDGYWAEEI